MNRFRDDRMDLPMLHDKIPIRWGQDPARLVLRKLVRMLFSSRAPLSSMETLVYLLERYYPAYIFLQLLYRWIIGGYIYRGYWDGLREPRIDLEQVSQGLD